MIRCMIQFDIKVDLCDFIDIADMRLTGFVWRMLIAIFIAFITCNNIIINILPSVESIQLISQTSKFFQMKWTNVLKD